MWATRWTTSSIKASEISFACGSNLVGINNEELYNIYKITESGEVLRDS